MSATELTGFIGICHACGKVYIPDPGHKMRDSLPCGHEDVSYAASSFITSALADSQFVQWAVDHGVLDGAMDDLEDSGGSFDPYGVGFARFKRPKV